MQAENSSKYKFYDFVREYHEKDSPHCPYLPAQLNHALTAVLDGQQRLTALNIGLCGSMSIKLPSKWWNNPNAFPVRHLYLDLLNDAESSDEGERYRFAFLTGTQLDNSAPEKHCWFKVSDILAMQNGPPMLEWINDRLPQEKTNTAFRISDRLFRVIHTDPVVAYYDEKSQDLSTVLNIFIRMNSGDTVLSYSDLLLSIAVAQWSDLDARKEIHDLVDELNNTGERFAFSRDLVLKAGLVLADIGNVGFRVENFNQANMAILEKQWPDVKTALILTVQLIASFGFNGQNLRATSALLPIAYYLYRMNPGENYTSIAAFAEDRKHIQNWLNKSLLKTSGIWGSGLDTLLTQLRETIKSHGKKAFPAEELASVMARRGKPLTFGEEELDQLAELKYGDTRTFALLSLLFPFVDLRNNFHVDHVFPQARFKKSQLLKLGLADDEIDRMLEQRDSLANLQLLDGAANIEKQQTLPNVWLQSMYPDKDTREQYCARHLLGDVPETMLHFKVFYEMRKNQLRKRIGQLLQGKSEGVLVASEILEIE